MSNGSFWTAVAISILAGTALAIAVDKPSAGGALSLALLAIVVIIEGATAKIIQELKR